MAAVPQPSPSPSVSNTEQCLSHPGFVLSFLKIFIYTHPFRGLSWTFAYLLNEWQMQMEMIQGG